VHLRRCGRFLREITRHGGQPVVVRGGLRDPRAAVGLSQRDVLVRLRGVAPGQRQEVLLERPVFG
jgi:hypothetical protein